MNQVRLPDIKVDDLKKNLSNIPGQAVKGVADAVGNAGKSVFDTFNKAAPKK